METTERLAQIDKEMAKQVEIIRKGRPTYDALALQRARDMMKKLAEEKRQIDYEMRKPFIKIVKVDQPKGNSSALAGATGKRFTVNPENVNRTALNLQ